jgi:hypothetical protein
VAGVVALGLGLFGIVLWLADAFGGAWGWAIIVGYVALWYICAVWIFLPIAVIAQAVRNKRHGVFSHLRRANTKDLSGGTGAGDDR